MNKEKIKQLAKEFCEAEGLQINVLSGIPKPFTKEELFDFMAKFLQSMIEKGEVVSKHTHDNRINILQNVCEKLSKLNTELINQSPLSSAGKEVKSMYDCLSEAKFNGDKDDPRLLIAMKEYATQFKSTPSKEVSDQEIEELASLIMLDMLGGLYNGIVRQAIVSMGKWVRDQLKQNP